MSCQMYAMSDEDFLNIIRDSSSMKEAINKIGYSNTGGGANLLFNQRCKELNINWRAEIQETNRSFRQLSFEEVFCKDSKVNQSTLRARYLKGGYSPYICSICGISTWNGQELHLRLDHINGDNHDNRIENLRWLCPNCDSQQDTFCGRNIKNRPKIKQKYCIDCGKPLSKQSKNARRCMECYAKYQRKVKERPTKEELYELLCNFSFVTVGKMYNVSDNAVRKWCRSYHLSDKASDYKRVRSLTEEQQTLNLPMGFRLPPNPPLTITNFLVIIIYAILAQLDRASDYESEGFWEFKSLVSHHATVA